MARWRTVLCFLIFINILGCGEGGPGGIFGGGGSAGTESVDTASLAVQVFNAINQTRAQNGLAQLANNAVVANNAVAAAQANLGAYLNDANAQNNGGIILVHYRNGPQEGEIVPPDKVKENLYGTTIQAAANVPNDVIVQWIASKSTQNITGHCENLLFANHHSLGVGIASARDSRGRLAIVVSAGFVCTNCVRNVHPSCF